MLGVSFNASASSDSDGSIVSYSWTFGDGGTGSGVATTHTYSSSGSYTAQLTVHDDDGATGTSTRSISMNVVTVTHFEGSADELTDPFTLPEGLYRVHLRTPGFAIVQVIPVAAPGDHETLFNIFEGDAVDGISTLYVSEGDWIMLKIWNTTAPYELDFEKIQ